MTLPLISHQHVSYVRNGQSCQPWVSVEIWVVKWACTEHGDTGRGGVKGLFWIYFVFCHYLFIFQLGTIFILTLATLIWLFMVYFCFLFVFLLAFHIPLSPVEGKRTIFFGFIFLSASIFWLQNFAVPFHLVLSGPSFLLSFSPFLLYIPPFCFSFFVTQTAGSLFSTVFAARPCYFTWFLRDGNSFFPRRGFLEILTETSFLGYRFPVALAFAL